MKVSRGTMLKKLWQVWGERKRFISLLVGVPSYEVYVEHMKKHHPEEEVVCQKQFFAEAQEARFNAKGGKISRCC
ncbi:putative small protein yjiX [Bacillus thuringiensis serovar kurstaki str. HD-1]|nr:putative small protein yjiX [Bacillus thuringiensis serovar kurstaki str. HD-1]KZD50359.1 putative small protein yjiX [Bacillus cereus]